MIESEVQAILKACGYYALPENRIALIRESLARHGLMCVLDSKVRKEAETVLENITVSADEADPCQVVSNDKVGSGT